MTSATVLHDFRYSDLLQFLRSTVETQLFFTVAYPGNLFGWGGGGLQQIQLRTEDRENVDLGAVAP